MNKIDFKNKPYETTPINASNLNIMQDNIEAEIDTKISKNLGNQYSGDLNDITETGFIYAGGNATNIPVTGYSCYITTIRYTDKYIIQKASRVSSTSSDFHEYERQCANGTWTEWELMNDNYIERTTISTNEMPQWYITNRKFQRITELKQTSVIGLSALDTATYAIVETYCPWGDVSIPLVQIAQATKSGRVYKRVATSTTAWGNWNEIETKKVLWTNPNVNPTATFVPQDITLSSSEYKYLEFLFLDASTIVSVKCKKGYNVRGFLVVGEGTGNLGFRLRDVKYVNDTTYSVQNGLLKNCNSTDAATVYDHILVPNQIIGYN